MINYQVFTSQEHFERDGPKFLNRISAFWNWDNKLVLEYKIWNKPRTTPQLNMYWAWMRALADAFSTKGGQFTAEDMHDLCRHKFLGYEDKQIGNTEISRQLKSVANGKIGKLEMCEYLTKIDLWAEEYHIRLVPDSKEYEQYKEART